MGKGPGFDIFQMERFLKRVSGAGRENLAGYRRAIIPVIVRAVAQMPGAMHLRNKSGLTIG